MPRDIGPSRRVLLVDDDADLRGLLAEVFEANGWAVREAADGIEGLGCACRGGFDVIVLDHRMPAMTGEQMAMELRDLGDRTPIVLVTAASDAQQIAERSGVTYWLVKPFDLDTLLRLTDRIAALAA